LKWRRQRLAAAAAAIMKDESGINVKRNRLSTATRYRI